MIPKLTSELSDALQNRTGPLEVADQQGLQHYVIVPKDDYRKLIEHEFQQWLQIGLDQEARGEVTDWDVNEVLSEAHRRFEARGNTR
jgi:hypothetical protein